MYYIENSNICFGTAADDIEHCNLAKSLVSNDKRYIIRSGKCGMIFETSPTGGILMCRHVVVLIIDEEEQSVYEVYST